MSAIARLPLTNLLSVTSRIQSKQALSVFFDEQQVEDYLLKKGASGIAVHRLLLQSDQKGHSRGRSRSLSVHAITVLCWGSDSFCFQRGLRRSFARQSLPTPYRREALKHFPLQTHPGGNTMFLDFRLLLPQNLVDVQLKLLIDTGQCSHRVRRLINHLCRNESSNLSGMYLNPIHLTSWSIIFML
jgi:hypothetical protein